MFLSVLFTAVVVCESAWNNVLLNTCSFDTLSANHLVKKGLGHLFFNQEFRI